MAKKKLIPIQKPDYSDCFRCKNGEQVEAYAFKCDKAKNYIPQPNCKKNKINCIFFE